MTCSGCTATNNFDVDPDFVDEDGADNILATYDDNNYRLNFTSLAINMGDPALANDDDDGYLPRDTFDIDDDTITGDTTPYEITPDLESPPSDRVIDRVIDVGAYETQCELQTDCPGDCATTGTNGSAPADGRIDDDDLTYLMNEWCTSANCCQNCCSDTVTSATFQPPPDGKVDGADLAYLLGAWGSCCDAIESPLGGGGGGESESSESGPLGPYEGTYLGLLLEELIVSNDDELAAIIAELLQEMMGG